jgi:hypothetical protein
MTPKWLATPLRCGDPAATCHVTRPETAIDVPLAVL